MIQFLKNVLEIFGIVYLRFRPLPRIWSVWLVAVNAACLLFIGTIEGQVVLGLTLLSVTLQAIIYEKIGFTRILGIVHLMWIPMFAWMASRTETITANHDLSVWLVVLFLTNLVSLVVDTIDATRFVKGERQPHYHWTKPENLA